MKSIKFTPLLVFLILFSLSCAFVTQSISGGGGGPSSFTAEATPYGSVKLSWDAVEGAQGYLLESQIEGLDFFITVAELSADQTSYEDYLAPEESTLTYRLQATTDGEAGEYSTASVTTVAVQPNPLTVQATFAEDQIVTQSIGAEGGSLSLTDPNGVIYELQVPAGAVLDATDFTLTPVTDIQGWPLDGTNLGSVRIGPESLDLYTYLTLTISLPEELPQDDTFPVGYGFEGSGDEFHIFPADITAAETSSLPNESGAQMISFKAQTKNKTSTQSVKKAGSQGVGTGTKEVLGKFWSQWATRSFDENFAQRLVALQAKENDLLAPLVPRSSEVMRLLGNGLVPRVIQSKTCGDVRELIHDTRLWYVAAQNTPSLDHTKYDEPLNYIIEQTKINEFINNGAQACKEYANDRKGKKQPLAPDCLQNLLLDIENPIGGKDDLFYHGGLGETQLTNQEITSAKEAFKECHPKSKYAYQAEGPGVTSPPVCDFTKPFTLTFNNSGTVIYSFDSGSWKSKLIFPGCTASGTGTYTLPIYDDAEELTMNIAGAVGGSCGVPFAGSGGISIVWKRTADVCP